VNTRASCRAIAAALLLSAALHAGGAAAPDPLDERLRRLESELRCLVCQNQTLADSDAPLALDLRREIRALATAGRSDDEIRKFLVDRYSDFVLYSPPFKPVTMLLWLGPFALLGAGALTWWVVLRSRRRDGASPPGEPSAAATARARTLLDGSD
jgi:cytochrome c-type biogenesis protein CcmH